MRKLFTLLALGATVLTANAQKSVQGSKFFDNWSVGVMGGTIIPTKNNDIPDDFRATYGVELSKQITPVWGMTAQVMATNNVTASPTLIDAATVHALGRINVNNLFWGYKGSPRPFEVEVAFGMGYGRNFYTGNKGDDDYITAKGGLNLNFNLGEEKAWTVSLRPAIVVAQENVAANTGAFMKLDNSDLELTAALVYHFNNKSNGKRYMTYIRAYDQAEVDGLNAQINDLRAELEGKKAEVARETAQVRSLQNQLNDCRNRKPVVEKEIITSSTKSLEQTVTFRQGKTTVDAAQLPNVERVATFLKNHKNATVTIKGYASPEGSAEINERIAKERAEAVKTILVEKYNISAKRITAEGQGVGNMFSEPDWNRVSICTIVEAE